jgi:hypothetical protein
MCIGCIGLNEVPLDSCNSYDGFSGNLYFIDLQGSDDPQYMGFGSRWVLVYLTAAEVLLTEIPSVSAIIVAPIMTLSTTLEVTSPTGGGNFSVAHGLETLPFLIEILQTLPESDSPGMIWAQAGYVDETNVNLVGSDTGVTATVLVYTAAAAGLTVQTPAKTLLVSSPGVGDFSVPHTLGATPSLIEILPTFNGALWLQSPAFDGTNIYLNASDEAITATISVYGPVSGALNLNGPVTTLGVTSIAPGAFSAVHGLLAAPSRIEILMISDGLISAQSPAFDATNVYLYASDSGVIAKILIYA